MTKKAIAAVAITSALLGAGGALWWQSWRIDPANRRGHPEKPVREEFVPAQALSFTDGAGSMLGRLDVSVGLVTVYLYSTGGGSYVSASVYSDSSRVFVDCVGNGEGTGIIVGLNRTDVSDLKRGYVFGGWTGLSKLDIIRNGFLPSRGPQFDDERLVPSEEVHLRNGEGWIFASLGLAASGDPGIALADARGTVRVAAFERRLLGNAESNWWDVAVFDKAGEMRLSLYLRPDEVPNLVFYLDNLATQYVLDFRSNKLTPRDDAHQSKLAWLPSMEIRPRGPIQVRDNRGRSLWRTP